MANGGQSKLFSLAMGIAITLHCVSFAVAKPNDDTLPPLDTAKPDPKKNKADKTAASGANIPRQGNTNPIESKGEPVEPAESKASAEAVVLYAGLRKTADLQIDLPTVLRLVDAQNLLIDDQYLSSKLQKNRFYRTMSNALPDVQWTYTQSHTAGAFQIFGNQLLNFTQTRINPGVTVTAPVYLGGRTIFESIAAHRRFKSQAKLLDGTRQEQLVMASQEYYHYLETITLYNNALKSIEEAETQVKLNKARLDVGVGTKLELMQAQTNLANKRRLAIDAQRNLAQSEQALLARLNLDPSLHLVPQSDAIIKTRLIAHGVNWDQLAASTIKRHPDIQRVAFELKALKMDMVARASDVVPAMTVNYSHAKNGPDWGTLGAQRSTAITLQSDITENSGFALPLDLRNLYLQIQQKKTQRDLMIRTLQTNVINAKTNLDASETAIDVAEFGLESAQESYRLASGRFKVGLAIFLDVLTAQTALTNARNEYASAISTYNQVQLQTLDSLGVASPETILGGFDPNTITAAKKDAYALKQDSSIAIKKPNAVHEMILLPVSSPPTLPPSPIKPSTPTPASDLKPDDPTLKQEPGF